MKSSHILRATAVLTICLLSMFVAAAQRNSKTQSRGIPPGPCHQNPRLCLQQINTQLGNLRAYVIHVKPGNKVEFNPQPDPPGAPPIYRNTLQAFRSLQAELSDLSSNSAEIAGLKGSPEKRGVVERAVTDAQGNVVSLGQSSDRRSSANALNSLITSLQHLETALIEPGQATPRPRTQTHGCGPGTIIVIVCPVPF